MLQKIYNFQTHNWQLFLLKGILLLLLCCSGEQLLAQPEINVQGGSPLVSILDGDATPSITDNTDFGSVLTSRLVTYTIQNTGTATLNISSIVSSGTHAANFVVSSIPTSVAAGGSATFDVTFTPSAAGTRTAIITINNDDADEAVYNFSVRGIATISFSAKITGANCSGGNTGAIDLTVAGGIGASTYLWSPGGATSQDISSLAAGEYTVTITNNGTDYTARYFVGSDLTWTNRTRLTVNAEQELLKDATTAWNSGASSVEQIAGSGGITFTAFERTSSYMVGLSYASSSIVGYNNIDYAIYTNKLGQVHVHEKGAYIAQFGTYVAGDIFRITRNGTTINYSKNGVIFRSRPSTSSADLFAAATMYDPAKRIPQVQFTSCPPTFSAVITSISCDTGAPANGAINLTVTGPGTYTFLWSNAENTQNISSLAEGNYSVTVTDTDTGIDYTANYYVGYDLNWTNLTNQTVSGEELLKDATTGWNGDASSVERVVTNGGIVFTASEKNTSYMVGLSYTNTGVGYLDIGYAIYLNRFGQIHVYQQGGYIGAYGTYKSGDIFRITRSGTTINHSKNGVTFYSKTNASTAELFASAVMYDASESIPQIQFTHCPISLAASIVSNTCPSSTGEITTSLVGEALSATYLWSPGGETTSSIASKPAGVYTVTATIPDAGLVLTKAFRIGNEISWENQTNVSISGNVVSKTGAQGWTSGANSTQQLSPRADGWVNSTITSSATSYMFGLAKENTDVSFNSITYAWYVVKGNYAYPNYNYQTGSTVPYQIGDDLRVEREGNTIKFYKNDVVVHQYAVNNSERLVADVAIHTLGGTAGILQNSFCGTTGGEAYSAVVTNINCVGGLGSIDVTDIGGFTYSWSNGASTQDISNLTAGVYTLTLSKGGNPYSTSSYFIGAELSWTNLIDFTPDGVSLSKVSSSGGWSSSANSTVSFIGNGGIIFMPQTSTSSMIGLSAQEEGAGFASIDYAVYLASTGSLAIFENGAYKGSFGTYQLQDVFKIERVGTSIRYLKNGSVFYTSTVPTSSALLADVSMHTGSGVLPQVLFIGCPTIPVPKVQAQSQVTQEEDTFNIYPNPSTGVFNVRFGSRVSENTQVTIFDATGRVIKTQIFEKGNQEFKVDLQKFAKGMYLIRFNQNNSVYSKSIIVE